MVKLTEYFNKFKAKVILVHIENNFPELCL